jgi:branched-chain amino acid transport system substrate-binding protein
MSVRKMLRNATVLGVSAALVFAGSTAANAAPKTVEVSVISSTSGGLKPFGDAYVAGLEWGLNYFTKGTMVVNNQKIVLTKYDDGGLPDTATTHFKTAVGKKSQIVVGTVSSGVALALSPLAAQNKVLYISGPAKMFLITQKGSPFANKYTFRSGVQTEQDLIPIKGALGNSVAGKRIVLFVEDNVFGDAYISAAPKLFPGATIIGQKVTNTKSDYTADMLRLRQSNPDTVFVAWSNTNTATAMWGAMRQQGILGNITVVTGLANTAAYGAVGPLTTFGNLVFSSSYFPGVSTNNIGNALRADYRKANPSAAPFYGEDLFTPDGVTAAQMVVRALSMKANKKTGTTSVDAMVKGLEGWRFTSMKGVTQIRKDDHALIQPMYQSRLERDGANWIPKLVKLYPNAAPPLN